MNTPDAAQTSAQAFTRRELKAMRTLRARYQESLHLFDQKVQAELRFLRWLHQSGRIAP